MARYLLSRLLQSLAVLWIVLTLAFFMVKATPGNPFASDKASSPFVVAQNNKVFGLDKPVPVQYAIYLKNLLNGEMGWSFKYEGRSVSEIIRDSFPTSLKLGLVALIIAILIGTPIGVIGGASPSGSPACSPTTTSR